MLLRNFLRSLPSFQYLSDSDVDHVGAAMRVGMDACVAIGAAGGLLRISAGNYGGKLGPFHFHLPEIMA